MITEIYAVTDIGCKRKKNQDGFYINGVSAVNTNFYEHYDTINLRDFSAVLMDGIGGTENGVQAVELMIDFMKINAFYGNTEDYINKANEHVISNADTDTGTTFAGFFGYDDKIYISNAGDSKIFEINQGYLHQLSVDDVMNPSLSIKQPLIQCIGKRRYCNDFHVLKVNVGNYMLCSDGLTDMVQIDQIEEILSLDLNLQDIGRKLLNLAKSNGGYDNITVILIRGESDVRL